MLSDKFTRGVVVKLGDVGELVHLAQLSLAAVGYDLKGTGYFGNATDVAVRAFQRRAALTIDGQVGAQTAAALDAATRPHPANISAPGVQHAKPTVAEVGRPLWLEAGIGYIGTHEGAGAADNPKIIDWAKEEGGEIAGEYTHDSIPWCALFANHCLRCADLPGTGTLWALDFAGHWPSVRLPDIAVGAFAPMKRPGGGHIMMVVGKDQYGHVMGLGGNQSDAVNIEPFAVSRLNQGFWWPKSIALPKRFGMASLPVVLSNGQVSHHEA